MIFLKQFDELGRDDIDQAGGKGANLGELTRAGLPVPPGFVIVTDAYRAYVAEHQLAEKIAALAAPTDDPAGYESVSEQIRALFADEVSDDLRAQIAEAYATLGGMYRSPSALQRPRKIFLRRASRASRTPTSTFAVAMTCWLPSVIAGHRSGRRAPSRTGHVRASTPRR